MVAVRKGFQNQNSSRMASKIDTSNTVVDDDVDNDVPIAVDGVAVKRLISGLLLCAVWCDSDSSKSVV